MKSIFRVAIFAIAATPWAVGQIYSNGPLVTHPGGGGGGADASALNTIAPNPIQNILGFSASVAAGVRLSDDFTIPCGQTWNVTSFEVFAYQTGSGVVSTLNTANYKIWNGPPNAGGAVIHDFSLSNQMTATSFTNIYRVTSTTLTAVNRPLMRVTMGGNGIVLPAGTYWLDWQIGGTLASGPFAPPITIVGQTVTGNAIQQTVAAGTWAALVDIGAQGMPFDIFGSITPNNCFALNITQNGGPGTPVTLANTAGTPGNTAFNVVTLYGGSFPTGWFFGVDVPITELGALAGGGPPFVVTLDGAGGYSVTAPVSLPFAITLFYVGLELNGSSLVTPDAPKTVTIS